MRQFICLLVVISCSYTFPVVESQAKSAAKSMTKLVLWHSYRAEEKRALEKVVKLFHKKQNQIRVKVLAIPYDAYADKINAAIPIGHGPDVFIFAHDRIGDWAKNKILEPITFWVNGPLLARFYPKTVRALAYNNALYGLPMAFKSVALFYNKKMVQKPPTTTKELLALAKKLTDRKKNIYGLAYEATNFYFHAPWFHGFGARVFLKGKQGRASLGISSEAAVKALTFARDLMRKHKVLPAEPTSHLISSLFNQGKAAIVLNGPWFRGEISPKIQYGVAPLPKVSATGKTASPFLTSEAILLSRKSKNKRAAFTLMKFLTSKTSAMLRMKIGKQTVANHVVYKSAEAKKDPVLMAFHAQMQKAIPMSNSPKMRMVWTPMLHAMGKVFRGQATVKAALTKAYTEIANKIFPKKKK